MEEEKKNSAWFRVIVLIAAIPICIYLKANWINSVVFIYALFLLGFRSKASGAAKNIAMVMTIVSPALLFLFANYWIILAFAAIVGICVHMQSGRIIMGSAYIIASAALIALSLHTSSGLNIIDGSLYASIRTEYYFGRLFSYIADLNIGLMGYIPVALIFFVIITILNLAKKNWNHIFYMLGAVGIIGLLSFIAIYVDEGTFISAYALWIMPMIICGVSFGSMNVIRLSHRTVIALFSTAVTFALLYVNIYSGYTSGFNTASKYVLDNMPELYSPHKGVFTEKLGNTAHSDVELIVNPLRYSGYMYASSGVKNAGQVRKILVYGSDDEVARVRQLIKTDEGSRIKLDNLFVNVPRDGQLHYINIPQNMVVTMAS